MKKKLVAALVMAVMLFSMTSALAVDWLEWVTYPDGTMELVDPADYVNDGWGDGELGDESVPLYALGGLAVIAATGAVLMHRKRVRVG